MRWLPMLAIALISSPLAAQVETINEPSSGVPFPVQMTVADGSQQLLMGTGIRTRTFLKVKVYAFGLYVDASGARTALSSFAGRPHRELERDNAFYDAILQMRFGMTMRLVMTRDVGGDQMAEAFDGALRPRVQRAATERNMPGGEAALDRFRGFFNVDELTNGTEIVLTCTADGTMHTTVAGAAREPVSSPALCWALFDVYLGRDPISGDGKKSVTARFPALLGG